MGDFAADTRIEGSGGRYRATLSDDWRIWGPNGGYLAAIALRAAGREAAIDRPATFQCQFLSIARFAEVTLRVTPVRVGRRSETFRVGMTQDDRPVLEALVRTAAPGPGLEHDVTRMPDVPRPSTLRNVEDLLREFGLEQQPRHAFWQNLESRPVSPERLREERARPPVWREWYRFRPRDTFDDVWTDAARSLLLVDTMTWPAAVQPHAGPREYTAPNLDVTAWFHAAAPDDPWLLVDHACDVARAGLMGTTARVWSQDGRLLASGGAQLFCVPAAPAESSRG